MRRATLAVVAITAATAAIAGCSSTGTAKTASPAAATSSGQHNAEYAMGKKILDWYDTGGQADSAKFAADAAAIGKDGINGDTQAMSTHCFSLTSHVADAQAHPAFPDPAGQEHWSKALDLYRKGSADCASGAFTRDPAAIAAASAEMKQGAQEINALNARVAEITAAAK